MVSKETRKDQTKRILENLSIDEIDFYIARYTGAHNTLISEKKLGFILDKKTAEEVLMERTLFDCRPDTIKE